MDIGPIGLRLAPRALLTAVAGKQHRLQHAVGQRRRQWPAQTRRRDPLQRQRDGAAREAQRPRDLTIGRATFVFEPQDLAYSSHRHSLGWHRSPRLSSPRQAELRVPPSGRALATPPRVADFKSEWPRSNRNQRPTSFRNRWPTSAGIRTYSSERASKADCAAHRSRFRSRPA